nr:hypothetical protein BaRGS_017789 [Batillaria attramentaria]
MPMLLHTTRHKYIHRAGDRSKPIVDPRKVSVGSVHIVEKLRKGFHSCNVDPEKGGRGRSLIDKAEFVIWMDTSVRWSAVSPLDPVFQRAKERGLQLREVNSGVISVRTTASTFDFYGDMTCQYTRFSEIESGAGIYHNEEF